jgi:hypothetical protein
MIIELMNKNLMKFLLLFTSITITFASKTQTFMPIPDSAVIWQNGFYQQVPMGPTWQYVLYDVVNYCADGEDTLIGAESYTQVHQCPEDLYQGAFRNSNGKVFFVPKDSLNEYLLFDFTVEVGDTVPELYCKMAGGMDVVFNDFVVNEVDSVLIAGTYRKRINQMWIEGIGNKQGFLWEPWINVSQYAVDQMCVSITSQQVYPVDGPAPCDLTASMENWHLPDLEVYPNPSQGKFVIRTDFSPSSLDLFDLTGRSYTVNYTENTGEIVLDLSNFMAGSYLLRIHRFGQTFSRIIQRVD